MSDIFLSYSSADRDRVAPIAVALERQGWSVWWDRRILAGQHGGRQRQFYVVAHSPDPAGIEQADNIRFRNRPGSFGYGGTAIKTVAFSWTDQNYPSKTHWMIGGFDFP